MQRLQMELLDALGRDQFHRRALYRLGDRLRVAIVVLLTFAIRAHVLRRHQPSVVAKGFELATARHKLPCRLGTAASWRAALPPGPPTTSAATPCRRAHPAR